MSLGSRIANRGRASVTSSLSSTPREPLLFLYSQWIRSSSSAATSRLTNDSDATVPHASSNTNHSSSLAPSSGSRSSRQPSDAKIQSKPIFVRRNIPISDSAALLQEITFPNTEPVVTATPSSTLADVEKRVRLILRAAESTVVSRRTAQSIRADFQEYRRAITDNWVPDWRLILDDLLKNTPRHGHWSDRQIQVVVPPDAAERLRAGLDDYIFDIGNRYGCSVSLGPKHSSNQNDQSYGIFVLSGSKYSISRTLADVLHIAPDAKIMTTETLQLPSPGPQPSIPDVVSGVKLRSVVSTFRRRSKFTTPDSIWRPLHWTQDSFLRYVQSLTNFKTPSKFLHKKNEFFELTIKMLRDLFKDPDPDRKAAITRTACHEVLQFLVRVNRIEEVRVLFVRMELLQLQLTPETFNIMLRGAAKQEDLHNFHFILHLMLKRGLMPNGDTWIAFIMALNNFQLKIHAASAMKYAGLLRHKSTMKAVCEQLIKPEVQLSMDSCLDQDAFVSHMDARYGREWLSLDSGNSVLNELGARGLISRCWDFLHFMESRFIWPDSYSINTILNHCKRTANLDGAVELMQNISPNWGYEPTVETFRHLFDLAWKTRSYNVAKVVWKYACISGQTTYHMRNDVLNSMRAAWRLPHTPSQRWNSCVGSVVFGNYRGNHPALAISNFAKKISTNKIHRISGDGFIGAQDSWQPLSNGALQFSTTPPNLAPLYKPLKYVYAEREGDRFNAMKEEYFESLYEIVKRRYLLDTRATKFAVPVAMEIPFEDMLGYAWQLDRTWREKGFYRQKNLKWLINNAIRIPIIAKKSGKSFRVLG